MSSYTEHDVKDKAVDIFLGLVTEQRPKRGKLLTENKDTLRRLFLEYIQRIGIHAYTVLIVKPQSKEYEELVGAIDEANW